MGMKERCLEVLKKKIAGQQFDDVRKKAKEEFDKAQNTRDLIQKRKEYRVQKNRGRLDKKLSAAIEEAFDERLVEIIVNEQNRDRKAARKRLLAFYIHDDRTKRKL